MVFFESKLVGNIEIYRWVKGGFSFGDVVFLIKLCIWLLFNCLLMFV